MSDWIINGKPISQHLAEMTKEELQVIQNLSDRYFEPAPPPPPDSTQPPRAYPPDPIVIETGKPPLR